MGIVVHRDIFGGGVRIRFCDGKLRRAGANACEQEKEHLRKAHGGEIDNGHGQDGDTGKEGEEKDDNAGAFPFAAKVVDTGIGKPCAQAP